MLRPRARTDRRLFLLVPALFVVVAAGCGDDDDDADPNDTVTIGIDGTGPETTPGPTDDDSDATDDDSDDASTASTHDIPSLEEVGRADFTHTVVSGDFLRKIADTYDVEIDDIVGANEWGVNGRDHLLLPGDVIYLPADAVMPEVPATTETDDDGDDSGDAQATDPSTVCTAGEMTDRFVLVGDDDTLEDVAGQIDVPAEALHRVNDPFTRTDPWVLGVPCVDNWPQRVTFYDIVDGPTCDDASEFGAYRAEQGETPESIAEKFGTTVDDLQAINEPDVQAISSPQDVNICASWVD